MLSLGSLAFFSLLIAPPPDGSAEQERLEPIIKEKNCPSSPSIFLSRRVVKSYLLPGGMFEIGYGCTRIEKIALISFLQQTRIVQRVGSGVAGM